MVAMDNAMLYIRHAELLRERVPSFQAYPFDLPVIRSFSKLAFQKQVTFLVGENGTGKSTLLEGIAAAWGFNPEGGTLNFSFNTRSSHSSLYEYLRLAKGGRRPRDGFFLRAESYYNVASYIDDLDGGPEVPGVRSNKISNSYGGKSLHEQSHGESFFAAFVHRFGGQGLYILDEPEAALSPLRQMSLLVRMHELVGRHSQFIIATHSPILMSYPNSDIYLLEGSGVRQVELEDTEHYTVTKAFMNDREKMLRELLADD
ncbi:AAA family ATPase [Paenibacillus sp. P46E]|uniref:AAA family ATPase n=1 Tax=Paenibacillus sp. P46E TaxID=1349436 RepID=UPI0009F8EDAD|nr:AAA family ATPase [Paenibacillus sp. P46E]